MLKDLFSASDPKLQDVRRKPPRLRPLAVATVAIGVFCITILLGVSLCVQQLRSELLDRLNDSNRALSQSLVGIERDLQVMPINEDLSCSQSTRQVLTQMAISSLLVREFFIQPNASDSVCGSFGLSDATWRLLSNEGGLVRGLQVVPTQSIRSSIVVALVTAEASLVAVVDPRQLLDRLPRLESHDVFALKTINGFTLAGSGETHSTSFIPAMEKRLEGWPLVLRSSISDQQFVYAIRSQILFWFIFSTLLTVILVHLINRYWQHQSSKAVRLRGAIKKRRFAPVMQPIVCTKTGVCVGAEVLMRWKHPTRGLVAPAEFIDYAERSGLIVPMSDLLMRQAHQQLADIAQSFPDLYFSFNITPTQLNTPNFSQTLLEIFDGNPLGPNRVLLELTERDLVDEYVRDELTKLRSKGFKIAIDDFGTGQSSLAVLQDLPIDKLKIDRAFVNTIVAANDSQPVLDAIIALAHRLNIEMVAEGIEKPFQADYLKEKNVQTLQGYYFSKPMPSLEFSAWVSNNRNGSARTNSLGTTSVPNQTFDLNQVVQELQSARHILESNRWHYLRRHSGCLLGSELVGWLAEHFDIPRKEALRLGKRLVARGFLVHVFEEHDLEDGPYFYRLLSMAAVNESRGNSFIVDKPIGQLLAWLQGNLKPGSRYFGGLAFSDAVNGTEVVDTLVKFGGLDRQQAYAACVQLMRQGLIKHSFDKLGFIDSKAHHYHLN